MHFYTATEFHLINFRQNFFTHNTKYAFGDFCRTSISDESQFWVPISSKYEKIKATIR